VLEYTDELIEDHGDDIYLEPDLTPEVPE